VKNSIAVLVGLAGLFTSIAQTVSGHPASGIVVDSHGQVFFIYKGLCKLDTQGKLSYVQRAQDGHWMCLDPDGSFSRTQPKYFKRISPDGVKPAIIFAGGGSPIAVLPDGNLYYVCGPDDFNPGGLRLARNTPRGELSVFAPVLNQLNQRQDRGITGMAAGNDGNLYLACPNAVFKVKSDGTFSTVADPIHLEDCDVDYPDGNTNNLLPYLRGLAADKQGTVFAAAVGCHAVVKISPEGKVTTALKAERPWSPTGVAEHEGDVYVLEYTHANESPDKGWLPRVRKIARDGTVSTLLTISSDTNIPAEKQP
jgi:hypothetical protein